MHVRNVLASLFVGAVVFVVVTVVVTELLAPVIWLSVLFGLGAGVLAGVAATGLSYAGLTVVTERKETGSVSPETRRRATTLAGAVGVGVVTAVAVVGGLFLTDTGVALAMLAGGLAALLAGVVGAVVIWVRTGRPDDAPTSASRRA